MIYHKARDAGFSKPVSTGSVERHGGEQSLPGVLQALPIAIALSAALWIIALVAAILQYR